ncbi:MAG TPA: hypothetical protein VF369_04745 [candidate division Zixibacteria bacterium]
MKFKTAIAGLGLLVIIFCTIQFSQAAEDEKYHIRFLNPPCEHPWQDSGSPLVRDTVQAETVCPIPVVIGPLKIMIIKPVIKVKLGSGNAQTADDRLYGRTPR